MSKIAPSLHADEDLDECMHCGETILADVGRIEVHVTIEHHDSFTEGIHRYACRNCIDEFRPPEPDR